ncbi:MAG: SsrA-binding protein SmpB [Pirellulaceae bacterium]|nr:SsrA-binding protein SmpB [Pirellulaceae bacterium]
MGKKGKKAKEKKHDKPVAQNRKARHEFDISEHIECGIMLWGSEVKSLRNGRVSLDESYAHMRDDELWLYGCDIPEYSYANVNNHPTKRPRKLLLHRRELDRFASRAKEKGLTLVPLKIYFNQRGIAKVLLGLGKGKKLFDKRESLKKKTMNRDIQRAMRNR